MEFVRFHRVTEPRETSRYAKDPFVGDSRERGRKREGGSRGQGSETPASSSGFAGWQRGGSIGTGGRRDGGRLSGVENCRESGVQGGGGGGGGLVFGSGLILARAWSNGSARMCASACLCLPSCLAVPGFPCVSTRTYIYYIYACVRACVREKSIGSFEPASHSQL